MALWHIARKMFPWHLSFRSWFPGELQVQWRKFTFSGGGQSLLNFRQNSQISDIPSHLHSKRLFLALL
jgi:hypothetical protein